MLDEHIAETDAIAAERERAGLITITQREDGEPIHTLTPQDEQVSRQMALSSEDDAAVLLEGGPG